MNEPNKTALATALTARRASHAQLAVAEQALAARRDELTEEQRALDDALQAEANATLEDAPRLRHARVDVEARLDVRKRALSAAEIAHVDARRGLADADAAVARAARAVIDAEIRARVDALRAARAEFDKLRAQVIGAFLLLREQNRATDLLTDEEWIALIEAPPSAAALNIGLPMIVISTRDPSADFFGEQAGRRARGLINTYSDAWRNHLAELERDEVSRDRPEDAAGARAA